METEIIEKNKTHRTMRNDVELMPEYIRKILGRQFSIHNEPPPVDFKLVRHQKDFKGRPEEIGICAAGEFFIVYGPPKSRKSTLLSAITASAYTDDPNVCLDFEVKLDDDEYFLFFDTEMPQTAFYRRQAKLNRMCDVDDDLEMYKAFPLKGVPWDEKVEFIEHMIINEHGDNCGMVIVDQVADLVPDINDRDAANELIAKIEYWTSETGTIFGSSIHTTRGTENATGVLGAEFAKKIDSGLYIEKQQMNKYTQVKHLLAREKEIESFMFTHNEDGWTRLISDEELQYG